MASVKIPYIVCNCPKCGKRLTKETAGSISIGSPLKKCKKCGTVSKLPMRSEWYNYPQKRNVIIIPLLFPIVAALAGIFVSVYMDEDIALWTLVATFIGLIVGLCIFANYGIKILLSKKRMKKLDYLQELLFAGELTTEEFNDFCSKIQ